MPVARGFVNAGHYYNNIVKPILINLTYTVTPTNGLGITALKSNGYVRNVFMHTSTTPTANDGVTNPNPLAGYALVQFKQNFNTYLGSYGSLVSPYVATTTAVTSGLTLGQPYIITLVGTTTTAEWQAIGLPVGLTPTVGQSFVATATGTGGGHSGTVGTPGVGAVGRFEVVGDPNQSISNSSIASNGGAYLLCQFLSPSSAGTISAPTFTGSALATHVHSLLVKGGQIASTTNDVATYATNILGKQEATDVTIAGSASATNGGVLAVTAGTPAGTVSVPTFTSTSVWTPTAPATGSVISMAVYFDGSSVTVDGL